VKGPIICVEVQIHKLATFAIFQSNVVEPCCAGARAAEKAHAWSQFDFLSFSGFKIEGQFLHSLKQEELPTAGFMNPAFYQIAAHPYPYRAFHDITLGNNLYYPATPDYDMASGLGTPDVWNLARDIEEYVRGHTP